MHSVEATSVLKVNPQMHYVQRTAHYVRLRGTEHQTTRLTRIMKISQIPAKNIHTESEHRRRARKNVEDLWVYEWFSSINENYFIICSFKPAQHIASCSTTMCNVQCTIVQCAHIIAASVQCVRSQPHRNRDSHVSGCLCDIIRTSILSPSLLFFDSCVVWVVVINTTAVVLRTFEPMCGISFSA